MFKKISKIIATHSQVTLIVSILLLILFSPFYWDSPFANYFNFLFLSLILLSSILTLKKSGFKFKRVQSIGYLIIALTLLTAILHNDYLELVNRIVFVLFYILAAINLLVGIVKSKEVDSELIFSAVAVYLLLGFCGALLVGVVHFFNQASFSFQSTYSSQFHQYLYFSFITFTTTGYGDILPISPMARTLAIFLAVFGQIYLTVIIGLLIGKYLSGNKKS
jgi:hypothetical protein